jgi:hypothetical protein
MVRARQHVLHGLQVLRAPLAVAPVVRRELPALERIALALLEALQLLLGRYVQPELDHDRALGPERALELHDLRVGARPLLGGREALHALHEHAPVPGAVEHGHTAPAGQRRPEAPEEVVALLVVGGSGELGHPHVARIELLDQALESTALARGVPPLEDHRHRRADALVPGKLAAERQPQLEQSRLGGLEPLALLVLRERQRQVELVEAAHAQPPRISAATPASWSSRRSASPASSVGR